MRLTNRLSNPRTVGISGTIGARSKIIYFKLLVVQYKKDIRDYAYSTYSTAQYINYIEAKCANLYEWRQNEQRSLRKRVSAPLDWWSGDRYIPILVSASSSFLEMSWRPIIDSIRSKDASRRSPERRSAASRSIGSLRDSRSKWTSLICEPLSTSARVGALNQNKCSSKRQRRQEKM